MYISDYGSSLYQKLGSSIMFNLLKTYIFGKILRTLEYPDGDLYTVKIHYPHMERLKTKIAEVQPPPYPTCVLTGEVRVVFVATSKI
jgi:hypothetical protein